MRAVFETLGVQDVVAKSIGSSNPYNMVKATFVALAHLNSPRSVATVLASQTIHKQSADLQGCKFTTL